jgi:hypothetical protein
VGPEAVCFVADTNITALAATPLNLTPELLVNLTPTIVTTGRPAEGPFLVPPRRWSECGSGRKHEPQ